jgi:hypothetical protein
MIDGAPSETSPNLHGLGGWAGGKAAARTRPQASRAWEGCPC